MSNLITNIDTMGASRRCQSGAPNGTYQENIRLYGPKTLVAARVREECQHHMPTMWKPHDASPIF
jgi:hypothetical protein